VNISLIFFSLGTICFYSPLYDKVYLLYSDPVMRGSENLEW